MKSVVVGKDLPDFASLPARGVRIEIAAGGRTGNRNRGHSPQGECGLKFQDAADFGQADGHSPQGECGLKFHVAYRFASLRESLPARGVRIEMLTPSTSARSRWSLPARGVRIEICRLRPNPPG